MSSGTINPVLVVQELGLPVHLELGSDLGPLRSHGFSAPSCFNKIKPETNFYIPLDHYYCVGLQCKTDEFDYSSYYLRLVWISRQQIHVDGRVYTTLSKTLSVER